MQPVVTEGPGIIIRGHVMRAPIVTDYIMFAPDPNTLKPGRYGGWMGHQCPHTGVALSFAHHDSSLPMGSDSRDKGFHRITLRVKTKRKKQIQNPSQKPTYRIRLWSTKWIPAPEVNLILCLSFLPSSKGNEAYSQLNSRVDAFFNGPSRELLLDQLMGVEKKTQTSVVVTPPLLPPALPQLPIKQQIRVDPLNTLLSKVEDLNWNDENKRKMTLEKWTPHLAEQKQIAFLNSVSRICVIVHNVNEALSKAKSS